MGYRLRLSGVLISIGLLSACGGDPKDDQSEQPVVPSGPLFELRTSEQTGIDFANVITETKDLNYFIYDGMYQGAGVAVGDFNNDNLQDIFFTGNMVSDQLYLNKGDLKFEDITAQAGVGGNNNWSSGAVVADVNGDGWQDIYVNCFVLDGPGEKRRNRLYINNRDLTFTESAQAYGLADEGYSVTTTFIDYDRDGDLDAYVVNQPPNKLEIKLEMGSRIDYEFTDKLYRNNGNNTFTEVTQESGVTNYAYGLSAAVTDFNKDGWPDIYVACDYDEPDMFWLNNQNGTFTNVADYCMRHISTFSMGSDAADINNDGFADFMVVDMVAEDNQRIKANMSGMNPEKFWRLANNGYHYQYMFNALHLNNGNGSFSEIAQMAGVSNTDWSWSALLADYDNDGFRDLMITNGLKRDVRNKDYENWRKKHLKELKENGATSIDAMAMLAEAPSTKIADYIFKNNGDLTFTKMTEDWGFDRKGFSQGAAYADLDGDGDLDLVINTMDEPAIIYANQAVEQRRGNYLRVSFGGIYANARGTGAEVEIHYGDQMQFAENYPVRGYLSTSENQVHFGLGSVDTVDEVIVRWPYGKQQRFRNVPANQVLQVNPAQATETAQYTPNLKPTLFQDVSRQVNLSYQHKENSYDDFETETLLPHRMSMLGPMMATGDVNGDKRGDFYVGGAKGQSGELFLQQPNGAFAPVPGGPWANDRAREDLGAQFFDADNDGDLDLYVVSGGNEVEQGSDLHNDRLYINEGGGRYSNGSNRIPALATSGSVVRAGDFDGDGDQDLFVGGRQTPGKYPYPAASYLLRNNNGTFEDISAEVSEQFASFGMVTDAVWTDFDQDGKQDLAVVGEWMPVTLLRNAGGKFENVSAAYGLENSTGWWNTISAADMDKDGDPDLIAGNLGHNIKYKASVEEPFSVHCTDFDDNGTLDIVLSYYNSGTCFPLRGRQCSSEQMPFIKKKFETYDAFSNATLKDVYGETLDKALSYQATEFGSMYLENKEGKRFEGHYLPNEAQVSSVNSILPYDFDRDGNLDLLLAGNNFNREVETTRSDASIGLYLRGDGQGGFDPIPVLQSGFFAYLDVKDVAMVQQQNGAPMVLVTNNNAQMQFFVVSPQWKPSSLAAR